MVKTNHSMVGLIKSRTNISHLKRNLDGNRSIYVKIFLECGRYLRA